LSLPSITALDFFLQVTILLVLAVSMVFLAKKKLQLHGQIMTAALALNVVSFVTVMGPAWENLGEGFKSGTLGIVGLLHVATGGLAFLLSFWLVGSWFLTTTILQANAPRFLRCYRQKRPMQITLLFWTISLVLGIALYLYLNTSIFAGLK
jgi:hypothetical protein